MTDSADNAVLEIRDPGIDAKAVLRQVTAGMERRRAAGAYGPDLASLGPELLQTRALPDSAPPDTYLEFRAQHQALAEMTSWADLQELIFTSQVPLLGHLVASVRKAWSWMASRWIEQHLMVQQSAFNEATVHLSSELVRWQNASLGRVSPLEEKVRDLEARLSELEEGARLSQAGQEDDR